MVHLLEIGIAARMCRVYSDSADRKRYPTESHTHRCGAQVAMESIYRRYDKKRTSEHDSPYLEHRIVYAIVRDRRVLPHKIVEDFCSC